MFFSWIENLCHVLFTLQYINIISDVDKYGDDQQHGFKTSLMFMGTSPLYLINRLTISTVKQ